MIAMCTDKRGAYWVKCADCMKWFDPNEDHAFTVKRALDEETICPNCARDEGLALCADCEDEYNCDDLLCCGDKSLCDSCANEAGWAYCQACEEWIASRHQYTAPDRTIYCDSCFWEAYTTCEGCGEYVDNDNVYCTDDGNYCENCRPDSDNFMYSGFRDRLGCTTRIGSERCFGIELETERCDDYFDLDGSRAWGAKDDCSVNGKEFFSDILSGDAGLDAIRELTDLAADNDWEIDSDCGYHLHIDMRGVSDDSLFAAAYAYRSTQALWEDFVHSHRNDTGYAHRATWDCSDIDRYAGTFGQFLRDKVHGRYNWINLNAYRQHHTFEIRSHHGTIDENEVCNWVKAHVRFVDWACTIGLAAVKDKLDGKTSYDKFAIIASEAWRDQELCDYYTAKRGHPLTCPRRPAPLPGCPVNCTGSPLLPGCPLDCPGL